MITPRSSPISSLVPGCNPPKAQTLVLAESWLTGTNAVLCQASAHGNPKDHYQISHTFDLCDYVDMPPLSPYSSSSLEAPAPLQRNVEDDVSDGGNAPVGVVYKG